MPGSGIASDKPAKRSATEAAESAFAMSEDGRDFIKTIKAYGGMARILACPGRFLIGCHHSRSSFSLASSLLLPAQ